LKQFILKLIIAIVILPGALAAALYQLHQNGFFNIDQVEVVIEDIPSQRQFLKPSVLNLEEQLLRFKGESLWEISLRKVSDLIENKEWVRSVHVSRSWPSTLKVTVKAHEVKMLYIGQQQQLYPVVEDGRLLSPVSSELAPDVVLLDGDKFYRRPELRKRAVEVLNEIPSEGAFSRPQISEVRYDQKEGFWFTLVRSGIEVKMGEDQVAIKAARVSQVLDYLQQRQIDARVIDANLSKKVLVRLRKAP